MTASQPYLQVIEHIEALILSGELAIGDKLESERALAQRLAVSRSSVREAIRTLVTLGLIRTSVGSGPGAGALLVSDIETGWTSALRLHLATRSLPIGDLVRTRIMLESGAYREVDRPLVEGELGPARSLLATMDSTQDPAAFRAADLAFHLELVKTSGNSVAALMMSSLRHAIEGYVADAIAELPRWESVARRLQNEHHDLVEALASGDGPLAADVAQRHIMTFARESELL